MKKKYLIVVSCLLITFLCNCQIKYNLKKVLDGTDLVALSELSNDFNLDFIERNKRINKFILENPSFSRSFELDGIYKEIYDVVDGEIIYYSTSNLGSSITSRANRLYNNGSLGLNIQGQGMYAYVWDGGSARTTHQEFPNNKVFSVDGAAINSHATHVMGTIVAQGISSNNIRGIAFDASASSYDWNNDYAEMTTEAAGGMLVSNHSYWIGSTIGEWSFGSYDNRARSFDQIAFAAPYYLAVTAAGNDRDDYANPVIGPYLNSKFGYNLIRGMQNAKNFLTVGAVNQVVNYNGPSSVVMSSFSSWGPTDDGRIKPEIVTKGVNVNSTLSSSDTATGSQQGTSMASPGVAGVALLLQQYYNSLNSNFMKAATLKGLILHSADEAGASDGPDYEFGWGLINAEAASNVILAKNQGLGVIDELALQGGQTFTLPISSTGTNPLMVSISWTDRAGIANTTNEIDPVNLNLVNDLDLRVTKNTEIFYPWTLNPAVPYDAAIRTADNFRDNFEKVQIDNPSGNYLISVTHKGNLISGSQDFSLIVSSQNGILLNTFNFNDNDLISVYPNPASDILNIQSSIVLDGAKVEIYDMLGKNIYKNTLLNNSIDISTFDTGIYMLNISTDEGITYVKKFIKK